MKYFLAFIMLFACSEEKFVPTQSCEDSVETDTLFHPKKDLIEDWIDYYYKKGFPGLALCIKDSSNNYFQIFRGFAAIETSTELMACHAHHSASVSKTYIATLILKLYEKGLIDLDEQLSNYLSFNLNIENFNCVTVRQMLGHNSGLFDYDSNPKIFVDYLNNPLQVRSWREALNRYVVGEDSEFLCGDGTQYSDTNYMLLGVLIEELTGKSLGDIMNEEIISPLELNNTFYKSSIGYPSIESATNSYFYFDKGKLQNCTDWQEHFANIAMGHEGIIATPKNYVDFLEKLFSYKILLESTLDLMTNFKNQDSNDILLGLGLEKISTPYGYVLGHSGGGFGTMTLLFFDPETKSTFFVGTNLGSIFESNSSELFYNDLLYDLVRIVKNK